MLFRFYITLLLLISSADWVAAQPADVTTTYSQVVGVGVLPDQGYSWARIRAGSTLPFAPADSLHPARARRYWLRLRLHNPNHYPQALQLRVLPDLDNTLYYFDEEA